MGLVGLCGGFPQNKFQLFRIFANFIKKDEIRLLSVDFACENPDNRDHEDKEDKEAIRFSRFDSSRIVKQDFSWINPHKFFTAQSANRNKFAKQLKESDIIYAHGGNGDWIDDVFSLYVSELREFLSEDKIYFGISAGGNALSSYYFSNDNNGVMFGTGVLPIKTMCHFDASKFWKFNKLLNLVDPSVTPEEQEKITYYPCIPIPDAETAVFLTDGNYISECKFA